MKIIIAPDSFKESMTALEAATAIENGLKKVMPEATYVKMPMADGGEGTVQSLVDATGGTIIEKTVTGPLGQPVRAFFGILGDGKTAVIEMAAAAGLHLIEKSKRNPLVTTTFGVGELILAAIESGVKRVILGLGGSATNDGGAGMAQALGAKLLNAKGEQIGFGGGALSELVKIDLQSVHPRVKTTAFIAACDVDHLLTGTNGASAIFGPQKGATPEMVSQLDQNLAHYAKVVQRDIGISIDQVPGAGAAGGLGAGVIAFLSAILKRGIQIVIGESNLQAEMIDADLVITGEGKIDHQTIHGKTPVGVSKLAKTYGIPVIAIAGKLSKDSDVVLEYGIDALFSITPGVVTLEDALQNATFYTEKIAENIARLLILSTKKDRED